MTLKYVVVLDDNGKETAIVFPSSVPHSVIAGRSGWVVSKGFCARALTGRWFTDGPHARPSKDSKILNEFFDSII